MIPYPTGYCSSCPLEAASALQFQFIILQNGTQHSSQQYQVDPALNVIASYFGQRGQS